MNLIENYINKNLASADIKIDGDRPWDIQIKDQRFYNRIML
jgi:cyclopropane-fatty-acyl-phospholipid synthase